MKSEYSVCLRVNCPFLALTLSVESGDPIDFVSK